MLERRFERTGVKPKALANRPEITGWQEVVAKAYISLDADRSVANGRPQPIPFISIEAYARVYGIGDVASFISTIRKVDRAVLNRERPEDRQANKRLIRNDRHSSTRGQGRPNRSSYRR